MIIYLFFNHSKSIHWTIFFKTSLFIASILTVLRTELQYKIILLKQAKLFWLIKSLRFNYSSVMKEPNWVFLHQCLISRLIWLQLLFFTFLGQNWAQKLIKLKIICVNLWSLMCFWGIFLVEWVHQHPFSNICENWII